MQRVRTVPEIRNRVRGLHRTPYIRSRGRLKSRLNVLAAPKLRFLKPPEINPHPILQ